MKWLALTVLVITFARHNSAFWMASALNTTAPAVSYVMGGILEAVMGVAIALLMFTQPKSLWRTLGIFAGCIAASEGAQMAVCRMAIADIRALPPNTTLCDHVTGLPVGSVLMTGYLMGIFYLVGRHIARR